jgi:hypothetical protein
MPQPSSTVLSASTLAVFDFLPKYFESIEIGPGAALGREGLDPTKTAFELFSGAAQRRFGIYVKLSRKIGGGEQDIAHLVLDPPPIDTAS